MCSDQGFSIVTLTAGETRLEKVRGVKGEICLGALVISWVTGVVGSDQNADKEDARKLKDLRHSVEEKE